MATDATEVTKDSAVAMTLDRIRAAILDDKPQTVRVQYKNVFVDIMPPSLEDLAEMQTPGMDEEGKPLKDPKFMARMIINNVYLPDTTERVFEDTDLDVIAKLAFTPAMRGLVKAISDMIGTETDTAKK